MIFYSLQFSLILLLLTSLFAQNISEAKQPNIVFILSDDQAWSDYGFMGNDKVATPNLDKLAKQGLTFKNGYVAAPICRPSLASIVTGVSPTVHGITGNDSNEPGSRAETDPKFRKVFHKYPNWIKSLTAAGYLTFQSGKWWEGTYQDGGFTHGMTHADPKRKGRHGDAGLVIGRTGLEPINEFIDHAQSKKKPFLVWYAPYLPHTPHNPPADLLEKYTKAGHASDVAKYYAMCEWFDATCGELLSLIDKKDLTKDTVIIYACDNGWSPVSTRADDPTQKDWRHYAQRSKSSPFQNGVRTPIMISWPGTITPLDSSDLAHTTDIFPTVMALAGLKAPSNLEGLNLTDPKARERRKFVFGVCHSSHNMTFDKPDETLQYLWVASKDWKLIIRKNGLDKTRYIKLHEWDTEPHRLYRLSEDPNEKINYAVRVPTLVKQLTEITEGWHSTNQRRRTIMQK